MSELTFRERPASGKPAGLLVLHHGRGADENDLLPLGDALDPGRRLHVVTPRAPLTLPGWPGYHWYVVPRVGYPDPSTFHDSYRKLAAFHDELWERSGIGPERTVLGGFSMGTVMSYALGLGAGRPAPAGILAFSGFVPVVEGWEPDPSLARSESARADSDREKPLKRGRSAAAELPFHTSPLGGREKIRTFIAHGRNDPIMEVGFARRARKMLEDGGLEVDYHESDAAHQIDLTHIPAAIAWIDSVLGPQPDG